MSAKPKILLSNNRNYLFQGLLKLFLSSVADLPPSLQTYENLQLLSRMGFLPTNYSEHDYQLADTVTFMLSYPQGQGRVSHRNLFRFLMVVSHVSGNIDKHFQHEVSSLPQDRSPREEPLVALRMGTFDEEGKWNVNSQEEEQLRVIFKQMTYTRATRQPHPKEVPPEKHIPQILSSSKVLAQQRMRRKGSQSRVQDRLMSSQKIFESRIQYQLHRSEEKQLKQCTFKPKITSFSINYEQQNAGNHHNRSEKLLLKGRQYDLKLQLKRQQKELRQEKLNQSSCSFHPDLSSSQTSLKSSIKRSRVGSVRNQSKVIQRMKAARAERQYITGFKQRGYPAGKSWLRHLQQSRKSIELSRVMDVSDPPSITLNLQAFGESLRVEVGEGESMDDVVTRLFEECTIPKHFRQSLLKLITSSINNSGQAFVRQGILCMRS